VTTATNKSELELANGRKERKHNMRGYMVMRYEICRKKKAGRPCVKTKKKKSKKKVK